MWRAPIASTYPIAICPRGGEEAPTGAPPPAPARGPGPPPEVGRDAEDDARAPGAEPLVRLRVAPEHGDEPEVLGVDEPVHVLPAPRRPVAVHDGHEEPPDVERELVAEQRAGLHKVHPVFERDGRIRRS